MVVAHGSRRAFRGSRTIALMAMLWLLTGVLTCEVWADTTLRLKERVAVGRATIRVADLAEVEDEDIERSRAIAELELCPTPTTSRSMGMGEIRDRLELLGVDLFEIRFQGSLTVQIEPIATSSRSTRDAVSIPSPGTSVPAALASSVSTPVDVTTPQLDVLALERFCRTRLERRVEEAGLEWQSLPVSAESQRLIEGRRWISAELVEEAQKLVVVLKVDRSGDMTAVRMPLETKPMPQVVFVRSPVSRGHVLTSDDLEMRPWPSRDLARATTDPQLVVGKEVEGVIQRDRPLDPALLKTPTLVRRGSRVTVISRVGEIQVSTVGTAMGEGGIGSEVMVQLSDRRRTLQGRITGENRVEVGGAAVRQ